MMIFFRLVFKVIKIIKRPKINKEFLRVASYHEAGHALIAVMNHQVIHSVEIGPSSSTFQDGRTSAVYGSVAFAGGGYEENEKTISLILAGIAAEDIFLGETWSGITSEIGEAIKLARKTVAITRIEAKHTGGKPDFAHLITVHQGVDSSEEALERLEKETNILLSRVYDETVKKIKSHELFVQKLAETLIRKRKVRPSEIETLFQSMPTN